MSLTKRLAAIAVYHNKNIAPSYALYATFDHRLRPVSANVNMRYKMGKKRKPTPADEWWIESIERIQDLHRTFQKTTGQ
jgi:hypothetical protein